jgi:hypothetical protein
MAHFIFRCPATILNVQHQLDDDRDISENEYEGHLPSLHRAAFHQPKDWQRIRPASNAASQMLFR